MSTMPIHYVTPQQCRGVKIRGQPIEKESACQCRLARPTGCANPLRQQRKPDRTRWRVWHIGSSSYCTFARGRPYGAIPANQDAGNSHPEPFYTMTKITIERILMVMPMKKLCKKSPKSGPTSICIRLASSIDRPISLTRVLPAIMPLESDTTFCVRSKTAITISNVLEMNHTETAVLKIQRIISAGSNCAMLLCWVIISISS